MTSQASNPRLMAHQPINAQAAGDIGVRTGARLWPDRRGRVVERRERWSGYIRGDHEGWRRWLAGAAALGRSHHARLVGNASEGGNSNLMSTASQSA